jgi:hypothetical protein
MERCIKGFGGGALRERRNLRYLSVNVKMIIIKNWIFKKWIGGMSWIAVAQDRDRWRSILNAVMNFEVL